MLLEKVPPSIIKDYGMKIEDAEVVVVLASILHDVGIVVMRERHEVYGVLLARDFVEKYLKTIYTEEEGALSSFLKCFTPSLPMKNRINR